MFERFTHNARDVLICAQDEARALRHGYLGTEHLLLGLLRVEIGVAARALAALGVTLDRVRAGVERAAPPGEERVTGQIPFTLGSRRVLERAVREAVISGSEIDTEHILLGLVGETEDPAAQILQESGADPRAVRDEVERTEKIGEPSTRLVDLSADLREALAAAIDAVEHAEHVATE